jgi:ssDNA-binding Zn-finger/Zn-ribbon topoisomerase 1
MDLVDSKYIGLVSSRLLKFKRVKPNLYNFRCPICGDSQKQKNKARGYFYGIKSNVNFRCHNCGASMSFNNFLREIDPTLQKQYSMEKFKEGHAGGRNFVVEEPQLKFEPPKFKPKLDLPKASENPDAKKYLEDRKIDPDKFYYTDKFKAWSNSQKKTFDSVKYDEPRIIIPLFYKDTMVGFQGRSLGPSKVKYITVMINDDAPKIYGLDQVRTGTPVYITEGPFDSTFIRNSIAMCGADADVSRWGVSDPVYVYDNEPRSPEIVRRIETAIASQQSVVIWPSNIHEKDINDMVLAGHDVQSVVELNVYSGLKANLQFNTWKRI